MFEKTRPFKVGDKVAVIAGSWSQYIQCESTVAKVYKTGNFILERDRSEQYRPDGFRAGKHRYNDPHVVHIDSETVSIIRRKELARKTVDELRDAFEGLHLDEESTDEQLDTVRQATALIQRVAEERMAG